uniref:protein RCC2 homolog n=1 Tax=Erigeron canadensis TaxID=72917 RepID=UPI001CB9708C|nr:protein RCC2 homolog [Erigeron canadensis]
MSQQPSVAVETEKKDKKVVEEEKNLVKNEGGGELLFCGATHWNAIGRRKVLTEGDLVSPTRIRSLVGIDIRYVASGCASRHCVALGVDGRCYTWGRNEKGQLGHGDKIIYYSPTVVSALSEYKVVKAACGGGHTVVLTEDGISWSFGWNKHGQLGTGSTKNEFELSPVRCLVSNVKDVACGTDFTVWLTSVEGATILTAGYPQYGQLGHGTNHEYNMKESSVRLAYEAQPSPQAIASLSDETIVKVACGANHTVALDSKGYVYTWGFGGYGRLGHREQKDEWSPRRVDIFTKHNVLPPGAVISAGSVTSACSRGVGQMYMWGKIKKAGDNWMYPKPLMDLSGWNVRCMDSGNMHHFVGADSSCISWGSALSGELGYGPNQQKSSAVPKTVDVLEGMHVISVACGLAHSLVVVDRSNVGDQLEQLAVYDDKNPEGDEEPGIKPKSARKTSAKNAAKMPETSNKRPRISEESSELEVEEYNDESENDNGVESDFEKERDVQKKVNSGRKKASSGKTSARGELKANSGRKKAGQTSARGEMKVDSGRKKAGSGQTFARGRSLVATKAGAPAKRRR